MYTTIRVVSGEVKHLGSSFMLRKNEIRQVQINKVVIFFDTEKLCDMMGEGLLV